MNKLHHYFNNLKNNIKNIFHKKLTTPIAIIIGSVIISFGIIMFGLISQLGSLNKKEVNLFKGSLINSNDYVEGDINGKVIVMEYSDTECPYCIFLSPTMKEIREKYKNKITFVYRHFPLVSIHRNAFDESKSIFCAGKLGGTEKYYKYVDELFANKFSLQTEKNSSPTLNSNDRENIANKIGLNVASFNSCVWLKETDDVIKNSMSDGTIAGVQGTPATFVLIKNKKGYEVVSMVDGARDKVFFESAINEAINKK